MNKTPLNSIALMITWRTAFFILIFFGNKALAQKDTPDTVRFKTVVAGSQYGTSPSHQKMWGKHYRKEWVTPVLVPSLLLDTVSGGLIPYQSGGGRQSKSLRLRDSQKREYVLRSIDKTFTRALPEIFQNTFIERIANDQVSIAHPYSALTIPGMAEAAKIFHTNPIIRWLPQQKALDSFSSSYGNDLYLLEQRPDENWETAPNFGNAKNIVGTEKLLENIFEDNDDRVDQLAFLRARLFDFFIGDWGRHEDQWRWAQFEEDDNQKIYKAIPRDRDQAFTKFDGRLLNIMLSVADLDHLQSFDYEIEDITIYNFPARNLDRKFLNELSLDQWLAVAKDLQQSITNEVIEASVRQLPPEVFPISGNEIIEKLKSRRDHLNEYASEYYKFLAKEVDISGTNKNEFFKVKRIDDRQTSVAIYKITKEGKTKATPFYSRTFYTDETQELRLYGIAGNDKYEVDGDVKQGPKIRIIGGIEKDSINDRSTTRGTNTLIYDNPGNVIETSDGKIKLGEDTAINRYKYDAFVYGKKGIKASVFYNRADKLYVGIGYGWQHQKWRRTPFAHEHSVAARYSIPQGAFNFLYKGRVNQFIGKWDLDLRANYDFIFWTNFFGIGNETKQITDDRDFYRTRSRDGYISAALVRGLGSYSNLEVRGFYQVVKIINDPERYVSQTLFADDKTLFDQKDFTGAYVNFTIQNVNDRIVPTKGIDFSTTISYTQNVAQNNRSITRYEGMFNFYLPVLKNLVLSIRSGGATLTGRPEFYQLNSLAGSDNLRGYRRDRFWAKTTLYNANELQYLFDFRSRLVNGKAGFFGLFDGGRVWQPGENSNTWHTAFGGGIMIAPFNKLQIALAVAKAKQEDLNFHLRFVRPVGK